MSRDLKRTSTKACLPFRQFVIPKEGCLVDTLISYGVTADRHLEKDLVYVQWYEEGAGSRVVASRRKLEREDEIKPHPAFGGIRVGELVVLGRDSSASYLKCTSSRSRSNPSEESGFRYGIVKRVKLSTGQVRSLI